MLNVSPLVLEEALERLDTNKGYVCIYVCTLISCMPQSIPFHTNMNLNLSFSIFRHPAIDASTTIESLCTRVFETRTATGSEHFAC